jgi:predicted nucleic-acid-binding Zn-ribbon protein
VTEEPLGDDEREVFSLEPAEEDDVRADIEDLAGMRQVFGAQGVKGVVIACPDCGENHFYEWELLRENLEHMLRFGEPRMHEPAFEVREDEYIQWDYGKGYIDALADTGLEPGRRLEVTRCPWCETPADDHFRYCPKCGRALAAVRIYRELLQRGIDEREVRALLVRAGFEPF